MWPAGQYTWDVPATVGGGLVPLKALPGWDRAAGLPSAGALRYGAAGGSTRALGGGAVLVGAAAAFGALAAWRISRGWGRGPVG